MSTINTGSIDINYPVPGVNNNSQGFRDNFSGIKTNLDIAASELSDLQSKAILKSSLSGTVLDNDMNHGLISNAQTQGFSRTAKNLGSNLSGTVNVDVSKADVHYGTVTGNVTLNFMKWSSISGEYPLCSTHLILTVPVANNSSVINFPAQFDDSKLSIENYIETVGGFSVTVPDTVTELHYIIYTKNCGETLTIVPVNRPRKTFQVSALAPTSSVGRFGDKIGTMAIDGNYLYMCVGNYDGTTAIWKKVQLASFTTTPAPPAPTPPPIPVNPTYQFTAPADGTQVDEGQTITFSITTTNVSNGTVLWWTTFGVNGASPQDAQSPSPPMGSVIVNNNTASFSITLATDSLTPETGERFYTRLYTSEASMNAFGTGVARSNDIIIGNVPPTT